MLQHCRQMEVHALASNAFRAIETLHPTIAWAINACDQEVNPAIIGFGELEAISVICHLQVLQIHASPLQIAMSL